jgi:hypothetical protein
MTAAATVFWRLAHFYRSTHIFSLAGEKATSEENNNHSITGKCPTGEGDMSGRKENTIEHTATFPFSPV